MSQTYISPAVRQQVATRANYRCEYCHTKELIIGMPLEVEHIVPESMGGHSLLDNLCLACPRCNRFKGARVQILDEESGEVIPLFNPRQQRWNEHFAWEENGVRMVGLTAVGRVTIEALQINNPFILRARQTWVDAGWHP